uniref:MGAT4 conserved region domain-containing protein n=1 Tax=Theropithecus gelada TaxID=9565 RepID=A0A8D2FKS3_THEGE
MNFASNLSDYFLLLEDHIHCIPKFATAISPALSAWKELPWVIPEFSHLSISGKVFRTSDLACLTAFLFLFHKDTHTHLLLSKFGFLLGETVSISLTPSLFHSRDYNFTSKDRCYQKEKVKEENLGEPNNPPALIYTNMVMKSFHQPKYAYSLKENYFQTKYLIPGHSYTVVFSQTHKVIQIQFLTGIGKQAGQVELGYKPVLEGKVCARYTLLGPLIKGKFNQKVYNEDFVGTVRCVRLLETGSQDPSYSGG